MESKREMKMSELIAYAREVIPPMTHPYGKYWEQPSTSDILIGEKYAVMGENTFKQLKNYSHSTPSGVYEGKMWRSEFIENGKTFHYLHWWSVSDEPEKCQHNIRNILII